MTNKNYHELISLEDLFDNGKRTFYIPDYQRGFSWEERQCNDLIEDLERILNQSKNMVGDKNYKHFMGTIVAFPSDESFNHYEIVDGQQRLTTLSLLLGCICHELKHDQLLQLDILNKFLLRDSTHSPKQVLRLGRIGQQNDVFFYLIKDGKIPKKIIERQWIKSDQIISNAFDVFQKYLKSSVYKPERILDVLLKDMGFILYKPSSSLETSVMFEVINNRGKVLSELEKVKNWLHYRLQHEGNDQELDRFYNSWTVILENLNKAGIIQNEEENSFLRYSWIVFGSTDKNKSHHVYDSLKDKNLNISELLRFVSFLETASAVYVKIDKASSYEDKEERYLQRIKYHSSHMSIIPLILSIYNNEKINEDDRKDILRLIERLNFRYYCCGIRKQSNSDQAYFYSIANDFYNKYDEPIDGGEDHGKIIDTEWIKAKLLNFMRKNANDEKFVKALSDEEKDFGGWHDLKFFLASYEYVLHGKNKDRKNLDDYMYTPQDKKDDRVKNNNLYQKEHIWARKCQDHITSEKSQEIKDRQIRRLGNFILLKAGSNAQNSSDAIELKVERYMVGKDGKNFDNSLIVKAIVDNFRTIIQENQRQPHKKESPYFIDIYQKFIKKNEEDLINFALRRWSL